MKNNQGAPVGIDITRLHLMVFWFFCANFSVLAVSLFRYLYEKAVQNNESFLTDFNPSMLAYFNAFMLSQMAFYVVSSIFLGVALLLALYIGNRPYKFSFFFEYKLRYCIFIVTFLCIIGCFLKTWLSSIIPFYILMASLFSPKMIGAVPLVCNENINVKNIDKRNYFYTINIILFLICCGFVFYLFYPQIFNKPVILNPYMRIPEKFKFFQNSEGKDFITSIDNTTIINDFGLFDAHEKIDIVNPDWHNNSACYEIPTYNQVLAELVEVYQWKNRLPLGSFAQASTTVFYPMLFYRDNYLCVVKADGAASVANQVETVNKELIANLSSVLGKDFGERLEQDFQKDFIHGSDRIEKLSHSGLSLLERLNLYGDKDFGSNFIKNSIYEMGRQFNFRGQFKHHIYYLFPAYEYLMGKPINEISHQYGLGMTLIPAFIAKIFNNGEPNYGIAINMISVMYYLAFFFLIVAIFYITHDLRIVILASLCYIYNQLVISQDVVLCTIGVYEARVFCSIPMMVSVYLYCQNMKWSQFFFILCCSFFSMFINFEFGLMITVATLGTVVTQILLYKKIHLIHIIRILLLICCIFISEKIFNIGTKVIANTFLSGFFSIKVNFGTILLLITQLLIYFMFFMHMLKKRSKMAFVFLYSAFLSQEFVTYYIWCGFSNHYFMYFTRHILPILFYLNFIFSFKEKTSLKINFIFYTLVVLFIVFIVREAENYHRQLRSYKNVINNYITYQWDMSGTSIISTMNPEYFYPSVEIISKYSNTESKEICLISQYDSIFLLLSRKISMLPTFDLVSFLMTKKENMLIEETIKQKKPEYLFVDNDILGPYELDIAPVSNFGEWLHIESRLRTLSLKEMTNIFFKIRNDYELIESTNMLSVYRRKVHE